MDANPFTDAEKLTKIKRSKLSAMLAAGVPFDFNGVNNVVRTRMERDLINISGIVTKALILKNEVVTEPVILFRAESNNSYLITSEQAIALGVAVVEHSEAIYLPQLQCKKPSG